MATALSARLVALPEYAASPPTRLTFLYSALAPRKTANPTGFHSALSWWKATLTTLLAAGLLGEDSLVLSANDDLRERLRWDKIGRPSSLGTVIVRPTPSRIGLISIVQDELAAAGDLVPLERYLARGIQSSSWLAVLATPLVWSFSRLKASIVGEEGAGEGGEEKLWRSRQGEWVVRELVEVRTPSLLPLLTRDVASSAGTSSAAARPSRRSNRTSLHGQDLPKIDWLPLSPADDSIHAGLCSTSSVPPL